MRASGHPWAAKVRYSHENSVISTVATGNWNLAQCFSESWRKKTFKKNLMFVLKLFATCRFCKWPDKSMLSLWSLLTRMISGGGFLPKSVCFWKCATFHPSPFWMKNHGILGVPDFQAKPKKMATMTPFNKKLWGQGSQIWHSMVIEAGKIHIFGHSMQWLIMFWAVRKGLENAT